MSYTKFGNKLGGNAGIVSLMKDLGDAMSSDKPLCMLGGGNPAQIPQMQEVFRAAMHDILNNGTEFDRMVGNYDGPAGESAFIEALVQLFRDHCGWTVSTDNIAVVNGSQSGFFALFNLFAGEAEAEDRKKILLPITPEYIGYADTGISDPIFDAHKPSINDLGDRIFKYQVDFDDIHVDDSIGAICVSRPTNPTGNVLTDKEMQTLSKLAKQHHIPLIVDDAYGAPFPNIIFSEATPTWDEDTILCLSLSKLGLPGVRTGIVIANSEVITKISRMSAIMNLAPGSFGPVLATQLVRSGEILKLSNEVIKPYYYSRAQQAIDWFKGCMGDYPYFIHKPEGAIFLWLWFPELPINSQTLYERLKERGVLVIAGEHFFPGLEQDWPHRHECIRVTYSQNPKDVEQGLKVISEEVIRAYDQQKQSA